MSRKASLSLAMPHSTSAISSNVTSPTDAESTTPSPKGFHKLNHAEKRTKSEPHLVENQPNSPDITSLPPFPSSPQDMPDHVREPPKGFFSNLKASKSSNKVHQIQPTIRQVSEDISRSDLDFSEDTLYSLRNDTGSTPDLSLSNFEADPKVDRQGKYSSLT